MNPYDLTKLGPQSFEHLVNQLAIRTLGSGHATFGPGADGGRDGLFEGRAPYPSAVDQWSGTWYIQSKFHAPNVSADPQKWLLTQIKDELQLFASSSSRRTWPDIYIVASNIDPSGVAETGCFDKAKALVRASRAKLAPKFHIWGGRKILDLLAINPDVAAYFRHFLTPGHVLTELHDRLTDIRASTERITRHLIVAQFEENQFTRLEQAGSSADSRPGIHRLFIDVPFQAFGEGHGSGRALETLVNATSLSHRASGSLLATELWRKWALQPRRAGTWFLRGGPGRGKSTIGQYYSQIQRAALIQQQQSILRPKPELRTVAEEVVAVARTQGLLPEVPRIPIQIDLKDYSSWVGRRQADSSEGVLSYLSDRMTRDLEQSVVPGTLLRMFALRSWFIAFDGLDEVPEDVKDAVAKNIRHFIESVAVEGDFDLFALCTSRPQGYSGQFASLYCATLDLVNLDKEQALACAKPVLALGRSARESKEALSRLTEATQSEAVQQLMTTPLQAHIMAIVVRDGGKPPERRWLLFRKFYEVIKRRESNKNFPDPRLAKLLREDDRLLKTIHNRLGFALQARSENSDGADSSLSRSEFEKLVRQAVSTLLETDVDSTVQVLLTATTDRLVLVSTPEAGSHLRFDVRQLQEFFAAEFIYEAVTAQVFQDRLETIAGDSHWREVVQFCISALIEEERTTEMYIASQVLANLNTSSDGSARRTIQHKLARGAVLASRLLSEGVLEQDRRIRQQFAHCFEPLLSSANIVDIHQLVATTQPNSRAWLIEMLRRALQERAREECYGAVFALSFLTADGDSHIEELTEYLAAAPAEYSSLVAYMSATLRQFRVSGAAPPKRWLGRIFLKNLGSASWRPIVEQFRFRWGFRQLWDDLRSHPSTFKDEGYGPAEIWLLEQILPRHHHGAKRERKGNGPLPQMTVNRFARDWTDLFLPVPPKDLVPSDDIRVDAGIFRWAKPFVSFVRRANRSSLIDLAKALIDDCEPLKALGDSGLIGFVPVSMERPLLPQLQMLAQISAVGFEQLVKTGRIGDVYVGAPVMQIEMDVRKMPRSDWSTACEYYPRSAANSLALQLLRPVQSLSKRDTTPIYQYSWRDLLETWRLSPEICAGHFFLAGNMLENCPASSEQEIRGLLLSAAKSCPGGGFPELALMLDERKFVAFAFKLNIETESACLLLAADLVYYGLMFREQGFGHSETVKDILQMLGQWIQQYVPELEALKGVARRNDLELSERMAAALLVALHPQQGLISGGGAFEFLREVMSGQMLTSVPMSLTAAIVKIISVKSSVNDADAVEILAAISDQNRTSFDTRQQFNALIATWRERSLAPISTAGLRDAWLGE